MPHLSFLNVSWNLLELVFGGNETRLRDLPVMSQNLLQTQPASLRSHNSHKTMTSRARFRIRVNSARDVYCPEDHV